MLNEENMSIFDELSEDENVTEEMVTDLFSGKLEMGESFFPGFELFWTGGNASTDDFPLGD